MCCKIANTKTYTPLIYNTALYRNTQYNPTIQQYNATSTTHNCIVNGCIKESSSITIMELVFPSCLERSGWGTHVTHAVSFVLITAGQSCPSPAQGHSFGLIMYYLWPACPVKLNKSSNAIPPFTVEWEHHPTAICLCNTVFRVSDL